ncbi:hypothetical protein DID80_04140 [Candidatus Marinamargulisbacteria bacterium SCGC AAA071-K20]|nr:hypothetical protein DID80_04140 [Candidatus Marinamargulisbacteria bacterium SCGC AAA071-K20]
MAKVTIMVGSMSINIRRATIKYFVEIWPIFSSIIQNCDTYVFPEAMAYGQARNYWFLYE